MNIEILITDTPWLTFLNTIVIKAKSESPNDIWTIRSQNKKDYDIWYKFIVCLNVTSEAHFHWLYDRFIQI